jgi:hypothetical protein
MSCEPNNALIEAALEYAEMGLRIVPLGVKSKKPRIKGWPERASTDPGTIVDWFRQWPGSNVGILTGGGLIAVDVDPRNGGKASFRKLTKGRRLPETAEAMTGSRGRHYLFRAAPARQFRSAHGILPGIDILAEKGMIVAAPSVHPTARKEYVWLRHPRHGIAPAPNWLLRLLQRRETVPARSACAPSGDRDGDADDLLAEAIERFAVDGHGRRNGQMTRLVASLVGRGYQDDLVVYVVTEWWRHYYDLGMIRTSPSHAPHEVRTNIRLTRANPKFGRAVTDDHLARCLQIQLQPWQEELLERGILGVGLLAGAQTSPDTPPSIRVTVGSRLCRSAKERAFVEAWVRYASYKISILRESPLKATGDQIARLVQRHHGFRLKPPEVVRLKRRYITREGRKASRFELAVQVKTGSQGVPSEFEPTGILRLVDSSTPREVPGSPMPA